MASMNETAPGRIPQTSNHVIAATLSNGNNTILPSKQSAALIYNLDSWPLFHRLKKAALLPDALQRFSVQAKVSNRISTPPQGQEKATVLDKSLNYRGHFMLLLNQQPHPGCSKLSLLIMLLAGIVRLEQCNTTLPEGEQS